MAWYSEFVFQGGFKEDDTDVSREADDTWLSQNLQDDNLDGDKILNA